MFDHTHLYLCTVAVTAYTAQAVYAPVVAISDYIRTGPHWLQAIGVACDVFLIGLIWILLADLPTLGKYFEFHSSHAVTPLCTRLFALLHPYHQVIQHMN